MSYESGEAQILTLIQAITPTTWTAGNSVSLANDTTNIGQVMMDSGKSKGYVFLQPGPFTAQYEDVGFNSMLITWQTIIRLMIPKAANLPPMKYLAEYREAIIAQLMKYERLNNLSGVRHGQVMSGGPVATERLGAGPMSKRKVLFKQEVIYQWDEEINVAQAD